MDVAIASGLEKSLRIGSVGLVASDVAVDIVWRKESDAMAAFREFTAPVVRGATSLEEYGGMGMLLEERQEASPRQAQLFVDSARAI